MKVFLCYALQDEPFVDHLRQALETHNIEVWTVKRITPGESLLQAASSALESSDVVIVVISELFASSYLEIPELSMILAKQIKSNGKGNRIIPVRLDLDARVPFFMEDMQSIDFSNPAQFEANVNLLTAIIKSQPTEIDVQASLRAQYEYLVSQKKLVDSENEHIDRLYSRTKISSRIVQLISITLLLTLAVSFIALLAESSEYITISFMLGFSDSVSIKILIILQSLILYFAFMIFSRQAERELVLLRLQ